MLNVNLHPDRLYQVSLDYVGFQHKPSAERQIDIETGMVSAQVAKLSKRIAKKVGAYTFKQLVDAIGTGHTYLQSVFSICPVAKVHRRLESLFLYAQLATVDFDSGEIKDYREILNLYPGVSIIYETFSWTPEHPKFRAVILFDQPQEDRYLVKRFNLSLLKTFPMADPVCKDVTRMNYGTRNKILYAVENPISNEEFLRMANTIPEEDLARQADGQLVSYNKYECDLLQQVKLIRSLPTNSSNYLYAAMAHIKERVATFEGRNGSRYSTLWNAARELGQLSIIRANFALTILTEAVSSNPYFNNWDKDPTKVILSGFYWGHHHRNFEFIEEKGLLEQYDDNNTD